MIKLPTIGGGDQGGRGYRHSMTGTNFEVR